MSEMTKTRKRLIILSVIMMSLVAAGATVVALYGQDVYMTSQGFFSVCSDFGGERVCSYCKCPSGGQAGFSGPVCEDHLKPYCVSQ